MVFSSHTFLFLFLPVTLLLTWLAAAWAGRRLAVLVVLAASIAFYGFWDVRYTPLLVGSILFNFSLARLLTRLRPGLSRVAFIAGIAANLLVLGVFKYTNFVLGAFEQLTGSALVVVNLVLPIGISFFTFQQVAFLADIHREQRMRYSFFDYALFIAFFPQLIAGPIVHHREFMLEARQKGFGRFDLDLVNQGIAIFTIGMAKKVLIADTLGTFADPIFAAAQAGQPLSGLEAWGATAAYGLQLYFDFSGYADMAIGLGLMVGVRLPENFDRPYTAASIGDFWRRWHITLSRFLKDYLYIPLGGNRFGLPREIMALFVTMLLGGIWHGAGWTFILWGALHGFYLITERLWTRLVAPHLPASLADRPALHLASWALTLFVVFVAWVPFRAESLEATLLMWHAMTLGPALPAGAAFVGGSLAELLQHLGLTMEGPVHLGLKVWAMALPFLAAAFLLALLLPNGSALGDRFAAGSAIARATVPRVAGSAMTLGSLFFLACIYMSYNSVFLYFQF